MLTFFNEQKRNIWKANGTLTLKMLKCASWKPIEIVWPLELVSHNIYETPFPYNIISVLGIDIKAALPDLNESVIDKLINLYHNHSSRYAHWALEHLRQDDTKLFKVHARLCNLIATKSRMPVCEICPVEPSRPFLGVCSHEVQEKDHVLRVKGLDQLIMVRSGLRRPNSVAIVSPVMFLSNQLEMEVEDSDDKYVEYCLL